MWFAALLANTSANADGTSAVEKVFPPFETWHMPSQLFWLTILFSFLYLVLSRMILPKLSDTIEKRQNRIASDLDEAQRLDDDATAAEQALELRMAQAKAKARETGEKARAKIEAEIGEETAKVDAQLDQKLEEAEASIRQLRTDAMANVEQIAIDAATAMTARLGGKTNAAAVKAAVSKALN